MFILFCFLSSLPTSEAQECIVYPGLGLTGVEIRSASLEDAIEVYGKHDIQEKEIFGCGYFGHESCGKAKHVRYHNHYVDFMCKPRAKTTVVDAISVFGQSKCKTEKGIQVKESTLEDIVAAYGKPVSVSKDDGAILMYYKGITYILEKGDQKTDEIEHEGDKKLKIMIIKKD